MLGSFRRRRIGALLLTLAAGFAGFPGVPARATVPSGFVQATYVSGLDRPTTMQFAPDGRLFVAEQDGALRVVKDGALLPTPFVTVPTTATGERGLLGIAFDPNFATNQWVYVYYTATTPTAHNRVSRFTANGDVAVPNSEVVIVELDNLSSATNHNGGAIAFGPDNRLYIATGENGNGSNAPSLSTRLGKILRINKDGSIPADNPFEQATGVNRAIWAKGLRNPFTIAFQPGTGRLFINDVGAQTWEEINDGIAGSDYGWPTTEGPTSNPAFRAPLFAYQHGDTATTGCAIAGGAFYNPPVVQFPSAFVGDYFYADLCSGWVRRFDPGSATSSAFATNFTRPVALRVAGDGALHVLARGGSNTAGSITRISASPSTATCRGQEATITGSGSISGTAGPDVIVGSAGPDTISGLGGNDRICGLGGNDVIIPGAGDDVADGGGGGDRISYTGASSSVQVNLAGGTATGQGTDTLFAFEQAAGSGFGDVLRGNGGANRLLGNGGNDQLFGGAGNDTLNGGAGSDLCRQEGGTGTLISCES